jgi:hypothetical protein
MLLGRAEVYILGQHPVNITDDFFLCSLKMGITDMCMTRYNASSSGQSLEAVCDENTARTSQEMNGPNNKPVEFQEIMTWRNMAHDLLIALSLQQGIINVSSSLSRVLTQLQLRSPELVTSLPSPAEALLSMTTCTVLDLAQGFPFVSYWVSLEVFF